VNSERCIPANEIVGLAEIAEFLDERRTTVSNWLTRGTHNFPRPVTRIAAGPIWDMRDVRHWWQTEGEAYLAGQVRRGRAG
jgi:hypothetical protein